MALPESLELVVVTPEGEIYRGQVAEVVLPGYDGYVGVLPGHAPLILVLSTGVLTWERGGGTEGAAISGGYAEILADRVIILAEVGELAEDIDPERAEDARSRAEARLIGAAAGDWDIPRAQASLQRALNRLAVLQRVAR